jgi:hypothetical protein
MIGDARDTVGDGNPQLVQELLIQEPVDGLEKVTLVDV